MQSSPVRIYPLRESVSKTRAPPLCVLYDSVFQNEAASSSYLKPPRENAARKYPLQKSRGERAHGERNRLDPHNWELGTTPLPTTPLPTVQNAPER